MSASCGRHRLTESRNDPATLGGMRLAGCTRDVETLPPLRPDVGEVGGVSRPRLSGRDGTVRGRAALNVSRVSVGRWQSPRCNRDRGRSAVAVKPRSRPDRVLLGEDVLADSALSDSGDDRFEHHAIAERVAELALVVEPPVNIALFGPWGSGKTSFYGLMRNAVLAREPRTEVHRYDAWKFGGQALKKNFLVTLARDLHADVDDYERQLNTDAETPGGLLGGPARTRARPRTLRAAKPKLDIAPP